MKAVAVIDYGMGNLHSVGKALEAAGASPRIVTTGDELAGAEAVVMPGVGHFGEAMKRFDEGNLLKPIKKYLGSSRPLLGICLGMQVLFEASEEAPGVSGLGFLEGTVRRFPFSKLPVPAIGWNKVSSREELIPDDESFYFVHSYYVEPKDPDVTVCETDYGLRYCAAVRRKNVIATQFHPEKSGSAGIGFLERWVAAL